LEKRPDYEPEESRERGVQRSGEDDLWDGLGVDVEAMSPRAQVVTSLAVLLPVVVAAVSVLFLFTNFWWLLFFFGWAIFPAFGLLLRGIAGLSEGGAQVSGGGGKERELLGALREHEEITPTQAAMETSLTVEEADDMLRDLAAKGHLEVRVRGGGIFYGLWRAEGAEKRGIEEGF
jgi:hypothetical protein